MKLKSRAQNYPNSGKLTLLIPSTLTSRPPYKTILGAETKSKRESVTIAMSSLATIKVDTVTSPALPRPARRNTNKQSLCKYKSFFKTPAQTQSLETLKAPLVIILSSESRTAVLSPCQAVSSQGSGARPASAGSFWSLE